MKGVRILLAVAGLATMLGTQGCAFTAQPPDPMAQQAALERWRLCLQRVDESTEHYCDGHRRDVLATFPVHLENHLDTLLSQHWHTRRASQLLKTGTQ